MDFQTLKNIKAEDILIDSVCSCGVVIIYIMDKNVPYIEESLVIKIKIERIIDAWKRKDTKFINEPSNELIFTKNIIMKNLEKIIMKMKTYFHEFNTGY
jgi:hypothetical protein